MPCIVHVLSFWFLSWRLVFLHCRIEELRPQLLSGLAAALPTIGNGLAAIVNYGEAHVYMHQLQTQAAAARAKAAAAQAALAEATAGEATALTQGADASRRVTDLTVDHRRLCGLASSCIGSASNWLGRHEQTLQTLRVVPTTAAGFAGPHHSNLREVQCLVAVPAEWDPTACDRPLALLGSNTDSSASSGILQQALHPLIAVSSSSSTDMSMLLPAALHQQCLLVDVQGRQMMQQLARLVHTGRWATTAYAMVLQQLLSGELQYYPEMSGSAVVVSVTSCPLFTRMQSVLLLSTLDRNASISCDFCCLALIQRQ